MNAPLPASIALRLLSLGNIGHSAVRQGRLEDAAGAAAQDAQNARRAAVSDEERFAWRLLDLARATDAARIIVSRDGSTLECDGREVGIRSTSARLILVALCGQSGIALSTHALVSVGWPGDRSLTESAKNRLHVALSALRKAGLGERLSRLGGGYAITATVAWVGK